MPQLEALNILYFAGIFVFMSIILLCFYDNFITHLHYSVINIRSLYAKFEKDQNFMNNSLNKYNSYLNYLFFNRNLKNFSKNSFSFFNKSLAYFINSSNLNKNGKSFN